MPNEVLTLERTDSCELTINQKGKYAGKVKVYATDIDIAKDIALKHAKELKEFIVEANKE